MEFDKQTGKYIQLIPIWQFQSVSLKNEVIRLFKQDILFNQRNKLFYKVQMFKSSGRLFLRPVTEVHNKRDISTGTLENYILVSSREDVAKLRKA